MGTIRHLSPPSSKDSDSLSSGANISIWGEHDLPCHLNQFFSITFSRSLDEVPPNTEKWGFTSARTCLCKETWEGEGSSRSECKGGTWDTTADVSGDIPDKLILCYVQLGVKCYSDTKSYLKTRSWWCFVVIWLCSTVHIFLKLLLLCAIFKKSAHSLSWDGSFLRNVAVLLNYVFLNLLHANFKAF